MTMRSRIIALFVAFLLLLTSTSTALAEAEFASTYAFPDDPGIPSAGE